LSCYRVQGDGESPSVTIGKLRLGAIPPVASHPSTKLKKPSSSGQLNSRRSSMATRIPVNIAATGTGVSESAFAEAGMASAVHALVDKFATFIFRTRFLDRRIFRRQGFNRHPADSLDALESLPPSSDQRGSRNHKRHFGRNPIVSSWVNRSLETMRHAALVQGLPLSRIVSCLRFMTRLGKPHWPRLPGSEPAFSMVHGTDEDRSVDQVHQDVVREDAGHHCAGYAAGRVGRSCCSNRKVRRDSVRSI